MASFPTNAAFQQYDSEFRSISAALPARTLELRSSEEPRRSKLAKQIELDLRQLDNLVKQLELEVRSDPELRPHKQRVKDYRAKVKEHRETVERAELLGPVGASDATRSAERSLRTAQAGVDRLAQAKRTIAETEDTAAGILEELADQRATIARAHGRVKETNDDITEAKGVLKGMSSWKRFFGY